MKLRILAIGAASLIALTGCVDDYGYGGMDIGYGAPGYYGGYYDDFYDGGYGVPYYGWYGGYYYPGSGYYVYDRYRRPHRWNDSQRQYWEHRGTGWRGGGRGDEWRGFNRGPRPGGGDGWHNRGGNWSPGAARPGGGARPSGAARPSGSFGGNRGNGGYRGGQRRR